MSPENFLLLEIAAALGVLIGVFGLFIAAFYIRRARRDRSDFLMLSECNVVLGTQNTALRLMNRVLVGGNAILTDEVTTLRRAQDSMLESAQASTDLIEARRRIRELEENILEFSDAGAVADEAEDNHSVISSAPSPYPRVLN